MSKKSFVIVILVIIFGVFLYVPVKEVLIRIGITSSIHGDNWILVRKTKDPVYDKINSLKTDIENRYNNYFPLYNKINSLYYNVNASVDELYSKFIYLKDNSDNEHLFLDKENDFYYLVSQYSSSEIDERMNKQIEFYNDINNKYPNINLMLYLPLRYSETSFKNINGMHDKVNYFTSKLNQGIKYRVFDTSSTDEYLKYFYKTDHHFNSYGAEKVYLDILSGYGLTNNLNITHKVVKDNYYGSLAKSILSTKIVDRLTAIDTRTILGVNINDSKFKPLKVEDNSNPFYDYFVVYFNGQYDEVIYTNKSQYNRNLLIICDSLAWQIDYLLANNFDRTFVVNMKYGKWTKNDLDLSSYIKDNNITHILFLRETKNIIFDGDNFKLDERVVR